MRQRKIKSAVVTALNKPGVMELIEIEASLYALVYITEQLLRLSRLQCKNDKCQCVQCETVKYAKKQIARSRELLERSDA